MNNNIFLENCNLCIRHCNVNRSNNLLGYCKSTSNLKVARAALHHWEEPCISGNKGSGTVFFSNCNLSCVFCQNYKISQDGFGEVISISRLSEIFLELQCKGAHNINLVTPTHFVPHIIKALDLSRKEGLTIPIVYNTNSLDDLETIKLLDGYIDVYLPDFKYFDDKYSLKYSNITGYAHNAINIIHEMIRQVGNPTFSEEGIITKGVIIRHLVIPGLLFDSKKIIDTIYTNFKDNVFISLMNQFTPLYNASNYPEINKVLNSKVYDSIVNYAINIGVKNGFIQDSESASDVYVPIFDNSGVKKN